MRLFVALAAAVVVYLATSCQQPSMAGPAKVKDFKELLALARRLESAKEVLVGSPTTKASTTTTTTNNERDELLATFAREPKSTQCGRHFEQLKKVVDEYKIKAYNYVADSKKSNNWFANLMKFGGPLGSMKGLSKFDANLNSVTERYESQSKNGLLTDEDVNCDMAKFQIKAIEAIMFVLQTDIKYLVLEDPQILNRQIKIQLTQDHFVSNNNFYEIEHLTPRQSELVLKFYNSRTNSETTTVGEAKQHFYEPGSLIIGRLLDSCHAMLHYKSIWQELDTDRQPDCSKSRSDPQNNLFSARYKVDKYQDVALFCQQLFDAL